VPGGQGALLAVPMPAAIQKKTRAEIKNAGPEIRCVAEQIADPAESIRSTNGSGLGLIEITAVLFARLLASSRGGAEPSGRCGNLKVPCSNADRRSTCNKSVKSGMSPIFGAKFINCHCAEEPSHGGQYLADAGLRTCTGPDEKTVGQRLVQSEHYQQQEDNNHPDDEITQSGVHPWFFLVPATLDCSRAFNTFRISPICQIRLVMLQHRRNGPQHLMMQTKL
jgi:hypothetical protein